MNLLDKFFFGASVGLYDIDYNRESFYEELLAVPGVGNAFYDFNNWYKTTGDGVDLKLGFICRPIEDSPFRFGLTAHTPTWFKMEDLNGSTLHINDAFVSEKYYDPYRYDLRTPWKLGGSLGYTIGNYFAIGAEYEYQDLSTMKYSQDGHQTAYFRTQNDLINKNLKGQSTIKLGMEVKPTDEFSIRAGYNYVSAPMKDDAYKVIAYDSPFTETDFTNWKAINRFTVGLGYRYKGGYIDLTYQYSGQKGDFYAFDDIDLKPTEIKNNRSQIMCTLGFRF
jgi:opacity protein-like surface antigen